MFFWLPPIFSSCPFPSQILVHFRWFVQNYLFHSVSENELKSLLKYFGLDFDLVLLKSWFDFKFRDFSRTSRYFKNWRGWGFFFPLLWVDFLPICPFIKADHACFFFHSKVRNFSSSRAVRGKQFHSCGRYFVLLLHLVFIFWHIDIAYYIFYLVEWIKCISLVCYFHFLFNYIF